MSGRSFWLRIWGSGVRIAPSAPLNFKYLVAAADGASVGVQMGHSDPSRARVSSLLALAAPRRSVCCEAFHEG